MAKQLFLTRMINILSNYKILCKTDLYVSVLMSKTDIALLIIFNLLFFLKLLLVLVSVCLSIYLWFLEHNVNSIVTVKY